MKRENILIVIAASLCLLTLNRLLLSQWQRIQAAGDLWPALKDGLRPYRTS